LKHRDLGKKAKIVKVLHNEYAAFRSEIVSWAVEHVLNPTKSILDPFAGTARLLPYVATRKMKGHFNDLLPHHKLINEAKLPEVFIALQSLAPDYWTATREELTKHLSPLRRSNLKVTSHWMRDDIVERFRRSWDNIDTIPGSIRPLFRAVLILCVRPLSGVTPSAKNRTWLRPGGMTTEVPLSDLIIAFLSRYRKYYETFYNGIDPKTNSRCEFTCLEASKISKKRKYDAIFTSPPFPNRFDYAVTYAPELHMLSRISLEYDPDIVSNGMLGTNRVSDYQDPGADIEWLRMNAPATVKFLKEVNKLAPSDEGSYYLRYFTRYYADLYRFILDAFKLLRQNGSLYMAVQNNIHRGELNNLSAFLKDFARRNDLTAEKVFRQMKPHQGRRNISAEHPIVLRKHEESIVRMVRR